jgi:hypothetical protein
MAVAASMLMATAVATAGATPVWTRTMHLSPSDTRYNDEVVDIAADGDAVHALTQLETRDGERYQLGLRSHRASGTLRWKQDLGRVTYGTAEVGAVAVDGTGIYVAFARPSTFILRKVRRSDGETLWSRDIEDLLPDDVFKVDIATHDGDLFVAVGRYGDTTFSRVTVVRVDGAQGDLAGGPWDVDDDWFGPLHLAVTGAGIYTVNETVVDTVVTRLDHDGDKRWSRRLPDGSVASGVVADATGAYVAFSRPVGTSDRAAHLRRYSSDGEVRWTERAHLRGTRYGSPGEPARDGRGVHLGWVAFDQADNDPVLGVRRYAASGATLASWTYRPAKLNRVTALAAAGGELYAGGRGRNQAVLQRLRD